MDIRLRGLRKAVENENNPFFLKKGKEKNISQESWIFMVNIDELNLILLL